MELGTLVLLFLSLTGLGVQGNPHAPSAAEVLKYAPEDADLMAYVDVEAVLPPNYKVIGRLATDPLVQGDPALRDLVAKGTQALEGMRAQVQTSIGVDVVSDVKSAAIWMTVTPRGRPDVLLAIRGHFPADAVDKALGAAKDQQREMVDGRALLISANGEQSIGTGADGTVIMGPEALVRPRVSSSWTPKRGRLADCAAPLLDERPWLFYASAPSDRAVNDLAQGLAREDEAIFRDIVTGHEDAAVGLYAKGMAWTYHARNADGYARAVLATDGIIQVFHAGHPMVRGLAKIAVAALDSYASNPAVASLLHRKAEILKLIDVWTGDGNFVARVDKKDAERRVTAHLSGKSLSDVVPVGAFVVPFGFGVMWALASK